MILFLYFVTKTPKRTSFLSLDTMSASWSLRCAVAANTCAVSILGTFPTYALFVEWVAWSNFFLIWNITAWMIRATPGWSSSAHTVWSLRTRFSLPTLATTKPGIIWCQNRLKCVFPRHIHIDIDGIN